MSQTSKITITKLRGLYKKKQKNHILSSNNLFLIYQQTNSTKSNLSNLCESIKNCIDQYNKKQNNILSEVNFCRQLGAPEPGDRGVSYNFQGAQVLVCLNTKLVANDVNLTGRGGLFYLRILWFNFLAALTQWEKRKKSQQHPTLKGVFFKYVGCSGELLQEDIKVYSTTIEEKLSSNELNQLELQLRHGQLNITSNSLTNSLVDLDSSCTFLNTCMML